MQFDFANFSHEQHRALFVLLILANLADGKLSEVENALISKS
jgi:hypothetical protein